MQSYALKQALTRAGMSIALRTENIYQSTLALLQHEKAAYAMLPTQTMLEAQQAQLVRMHARQLHPST